MSILWMDGRKVKKDRRSLLMKMGYSVYDKVRIRLAQDNEWKCHYCGCPISRTPDRKEALATVDHKIPLSRGGVWKRFNITSACRECNESKDDMTEDEFRFFLYLMQEPKMTTVTLTEREKVEKAKRQEFIDKIKQDVFEVVYAREDDKSGFTYLTLKKKK